MTEQEEKLKNETENKPENDNKNGEFELDETALNGETDLQAVADKLAEEHEKSKKKKFWGGNKDKKNRGLENKIERLTEQLKKSDEKINELETNLKLMVAENRNQKNRIENEFRTKIKFAVEDFFRDFILVRDDFDKAMDFAPKGEEAEKDPFLQGIKHLLNKIEDVGKRHGLVGFSSIGEKFDPAFHEAMSMADVDGKEANEIVAEYVKGYKLHDRILRPAMVVVASGNPATKTGEKTQHVENIEENCDSSDEKTGTPNKENGNSVKEEIQPDEEKPADSCQTDFDNIEH